MKLTECVAALRQTAMDDQRGLMVDYELVQRVTRILAQYTSHQAELQSRELWGKDVDSE